MKIKNGVAELWTSLNPAIELGEILDGFLEAFAGMAGKEIAIEAGHAAAFDEQQFCLVDERQPDSLPQNTRITLPEHGAEILQNNFSIAMPGDAASGYVTEFLEFCWPDNPPRAHVQAHQQHALSGLWSIKKTPAIAFYGVRNTTWKDPYTSVHFRIAAGALGLRSVHTAALLQVLEQDLEFNGPHEVLADMHAKLLPIHARIVQYESEHAAFFEQRRQTFLSLGMEVLAHIALNKHFLIKERESASPVDLLIGQTTDENNPWSMPDPDALALSAWCERIGWEGFEEQRALAFLQHQKQDDKLAKQIVSHCIGLGKYTWPGLIEVLAAPPISYQCQLEIISFLADPNWPGAGEAYDVIQQNPALFEQALQESYREAQEANDESWLAMIGDLLGIESAD